jgi:SAM-dependent methyltransferase
VINTNHESISERWKSISSFLKYWFEENPLSTPEKLTFEHYYQSYYRRFGTYIRHNYEEQTREITTAIKGASLPKVLEVGAGCGTESLWFGLLGAQVSAIDINVDRLSVANARKEWLQNRLKAPLKVEYIETSLFDYKPTHKFDFIWMEQTFHHLEPRNKVYGVLREFLVPGGLLFISESNAWNPLVQLELFLRRGFKTRTYFTDKNGRRIEYGNERVIAPVILARALKKNGFSEIKTRRFRTLPNYFNPPFAEAWLTIEQQILKLLPFIATHYNVVAKKLA